MATASDDTKTKTKTVTRKSARAAGQKTAKPTAEARTKRSRAVAAKSKAKAAEAAATDKGLADLFEHALADMYYAEKKIYKTLPKMIKAADHLRCRRRRDHLQLSGSRALRDHALRLDARLCRGLGDG